MDEAFPVFPHVPISPWQEAAAAVSNKPAYLSCDVMGHTLIYLKFGEICAGSHHVPPPLPRRRNQDISDLGSTWDIALLFIRVIQYLYTVYVIASLWHGLRGRRMSVCTCAPASRNHLALGTRSKDIFRGAYHMITSRFRNYQVFNQYDTDRENHSLLFQLSIIANIPDSLNDYVVYKLGGTAL